MPNELIVIERQLETYQPRFEDMLRGSLMDYRTLRAGVMVSCERTPRLLECTPQSIINCANTAAGLRLPIDGASGQFFMLPFKNKGVMQAQPCPGYKGFNTIGARGGLSIQNGVVREGDDIWDFELGTGGFVKHRPKLDNKGKIIAAYAFAKALDRPPVVAVIGIGEIESIMARSPAVRGGSDTPWKDPVVGFPAMAAKTGTRRLSRFIPWNVDDGRFHLAARIDENFEERGIASHLDAEGKLIEEPSSPIAEGELSRTPSAAQITSPRNGAAQEVPEKILAQARASLAEAAAGGTWPLQQAWKSLAFIVQKALADPNGSGCPQEYKTIAEQADKDAEGSAI